MGIATDVLTMGGSKIADDLAKRGGSSDSSDSASDSDAPSKLRAVSLDDYTDDPGVAPGYGKRRSNRKRQ